MQTSVKQGISAADVRFFWLSCSAVTWVLRGIALPGVIIGLFHASLTAWAGEGDVKQPFTVKDLIEISHFVELGRMTDQHHQKEEPVIYSPNRKYFLTVTQRGVLTNNTLEATIWLFDAQDVRNYALGKSKVQAKPRKLATVSATSNTPVISDVRWMEGSKQISFLAKNHNPYQRLFVVNIETGLMTAMTKEGLYTTAYQIRGRTIAYTALSLDQPLVDLSSMDLIDVGETKVDGVPFSPTNVLLFSRNRPAIEDFERRFLSKASHSLRVQKGGKGIPTDFLAGKKPLRLFSPCAFSPPLFLSPNGKLLVTLMRVEEVPGEWEQYRPAIEGLRLKAGRVQVTYGCQPPEQYVVVNLETGSVSPLVDAPTGSSLGYDIAADAFWLEDNRHVILTNTFLPISKSSGEKSSTQRIEHPTVTLVDLSIREVQANIELRDSYEAQPYHIDGIAWNGNKRELTISYYGGNKRALAVLNRLGGATDVPPPAPERYVLTSGQWMKLQEADARPYSASEQEVKISVHEDLNHPPILRMERSGGESDSLLLDPNPQMHNLRIGKASVYRWQDAEGRNFSGILVLPPDYDPNRRYPLLIQTHGYGDEGSEFFADGEHTTSNGGRAVAAKDMIVLQTDLFLKNVGTPGESPDQVAGFESAINHLVADGLVDRNRVGVDGFSRTCLHVLYALTHRPDLFQVASITDGVNLSYVAYMLSSPRDAIQTEAEAVNAGVPFGDGLVKWFQNAPNFSLDKVQAPLLISAYLPGQILSEWETYSGLRRLNKPVEMLWWWRENTPHYLEQPHQRYLSQQLAVDWFVFWLKGEEDSDPAKAAQYARWRELRKLQERNDAKDKAADGKPPSLN